MSEIERSRSKTPRSVRERRAYQLMLAGGALGVVAVVGVVLAIAGAVGWGLPFIAAVLAIVCGVLFRRTVGP